MGGDGRNQCWSPLLVGESVDSSLKNRTLCEIWAEKRCTAAAVIDGDGFVVHSATYNFYIRRRSDITATMRVKWKDPASKKDRFFILQGPPIDWKGEPNGLTLITKELV